MLFLLGYPSALLDGAPVNVPPVANFTWSAGGLSVAFQDDSIDTDGTIASWAWDFGDAGTSTSQNPLHTYAGPGTYSVELTVTDNGGLTHDITKSVTVANPTVGGAKQKRRRRIAA